MNTLAEKQKESTSLKLLMLDLRAGRRRVVSDETLDAILAQFPIDSGIVATCYNSAQIGTRDTFVAWIGKENAPADMHYRASKTYGQSAYGSAGGA